MESIVKSTKQATSIPVAIKLSLLKPQRIKNSLYMHAFFMA